MCGGCLGKFIERLLRGSLVFDFVFDFYLVVFATVYHPLSFAPSVRKRGGGK